MKGAELPISTIVIMVLVLIVLLGIVALWMSGWGGGAQGVTVEAAKSTACAVVMRYYDGCTAKHTYNVRIDNFDANHDTFINGGTELAYPANCLPVGGSDNLARLCVCYYNALTDSDCRRVCGCGG